MRIIPHDISERLARTMQTTANNSNPSSDIWINRPYTALVSDVFLERQKIFDTSVTDVSIAVCHPRFKSDNTMVYVGYISDGKAKIVSAVTKSKIDEHLWLQNEFEEEATHISVAFNGTMPKGVDGRVEFVTEVVPWVFWIQNGALYARKLEDTNEPVSLATSNCTDVSVISASDSDIGGFDFGLIVFFAMGGGLFYRQLISGEWMDAVPVANVPGNIVKVAAFRTWDYRVGVQFQTAEGKTYELFTQYMGIGKRNVEHLDVTGFETKSTYTSITKHDTSTLGNIDIPIVAVDGVCAWAFSSVPVHAENFADENGDYGYYVRVVFDHPIKEISSHAGQFAMVDTFGLTYGCKNATLSDDGISAEFEFTNFNLSEGNDLKFYYTAGNNPVQCPGVALDNFEITFTPIGLVRPDIPLPEPISAWVVDSGGTELRIEFTEELIPETVANSKDAFKVYVNEYDMIPGGVMSKNLRNNISISLDEETKRIVCITFKEGNTTSLQNGIEVIIDYSNGTVCGYGGPVMFFEIIIDSHSMTQKTNPNDLSRIGIADFTISGVLKKITYTDVTAPDEHAIIVSDFSVNGLLIHIDDL